MKHLFLLASIFFTGGTGLILQLLLGVVATSILGSSVFMIGFVTTLFILGLGLGSVSQSVMNDDNLIMKFLTVEILLSLIGSFSVIMLTWSYSNNPDVFMIELTFGVMMIAFLCGFEIPIILRLMEKLNVEIRYSSGMVFFADFIGAAFGGLIWLFWLLGSVPLVNVAFLVLVPNLVIALIAALVYTEKLNPIPIIVCFATFLLMLFGYANFEKWQIDIDQKLYDSPIQENITSQYQKIVLTSNPNINQSGVKGDVRLFLNGGLQFSSIDTDVYHENLVHPIMSKHDNPKSVLVLGGGDGLAVREILKYDSVERIDLVDLDPMMTNFASTNKLMIELNDSSLTNNKVHVHHNDGLNWMRNVSKQFDIIIVDLPDPKNLDLNKLYSKEFYQQIKHHLNPNGLYVVQSTSPFHAEPVFLQIGNTLKSAGLKVIPYWDNVPSFGQWGWWHGCNCENMQLESNNFEVETTYLTPNKFNANLVFSKRLETLIDSNNLGVNTIMNPRTFALYDQQWSVY